MMYRSWRSCNELWQLLSEHPVPDMTYNVFGGTLNLAQLSCLNSPSAARFRRLICTECDENNVLRPYAGTHNALPLVPKRRHTNTDFGSVW